MKSLPDSRTLAVMAALTATGLAGAAIGAGMFAALGGSGTTTTVVRSVSAPSQPAALNSSGLTVNGVYGVAHEGVVEVDVSSNSTTPFPFGGSRSQEALGSGFVYDAQGHIVTNEHVVDGATSVKVTLASGKSYKATLVGTDPSTDLAVLKIDAPASALHPLTLGSSSGLRIGDGVVAIGSPFGLEGTVTSGIVSALDRQIDSPNGFAIDGAIQTDAAINHGNSGGPLLDMNGRVVGVTTQIESQSGGSEGVGFAIPASTVRAVASQLIGSGKVDHPYLGVRIGTVAARAGAKISQVNSGTPAAKAGLRSGDVITAANGKKITTADQLRSIIQSMHAGDKLKLTYLRAGASHTATVVLANRPS
ncbi:MAG: S1C family serine protease [Gaiellaceae bacterium]